jgi:hypothetical protein
LSGDLGLPDLCLDKRTESINDAAMVESCGLTALVRHPNADHLGLGRAYATWPAALPEAQPVPSPGLKGGCASRQEAAAATGSAWPPALPADAPRAAPASPAKPAVQPQY